MEHASMAMGTLANQAKLIKTTDHAERIRELQEIVKQRRK